MLQKKELRNEFLRKRKALGKNLTEELSKQISDMFFQHFSLQNIACLHSFLPIESLNEINTWLIIKELQEKHEHIQIAIPKTNPWDFSMEAYELLPNTTLVKGNFGVLEPLQALKIELQTIDLMLVPLLCFDEQGYRLGYGKGFYDRFLKQCSPKIVKVGLSFFEPVAQLPEVDSYDIPLHFCITPQKVYSFKI